jgi:predicted ATPase
MKIHFTYSYKSLGPFESENLPPFTVIIGKNGSGKTQLIEKIREYSNTLNVSHKKLTFWIEPQPKSIYCEPLIVNNIQLGTPVNYRNQFVAIYNDYQKISQHYSISKAWNNLYQKGVLRKQIENYSFTSLDDIIELKDFLSFGSNRFVDSDLEYLGHHPQVGLDAQTFLFYRTFLTELVESLESYEISSAVAREQKKDIFTLTLNDFLASNIPDKFLNKANLIESKVEDIFYNYLRRRSANDYNYYKKLNHSEQNSAVSLQEFEKGNPNPILQINSLLKSAGLPYYFRNISVKEFNPETAVNFDFKKLGVEQNVLFNDLSSGEKIVIGLIIRLFTSNYYQNELKFPDLIVLDEPDAHLHPEMSKILLEVLNESFVKKIGIRTIITTHSPTTVALAPEESIFQLHNLPKTTLKKIGKDEALRTLTAGLPNLSINYQNHRQVFVESPTDLLYYQTLFNKFNGDKGAVFQLYFISNGYGKGDCDQVRKIVKDLRDSGNSTSYGIIDWDKKNVDSNTIFVHGHNKRYSIENYLFDPIFLSILLLEQRYGDLKKAIDYNETENQYDIIKCAKAQKCIDYLVSVIEPRNKHLAIDKRPVPHTYGEFTYHIPAWFTSLKGHDLRTQFIDAFQCLGSIKTKGDYEIESKLINIIAKLYPNVPNDTIDLLKKLSS